jgi:hypothetical protein
MVMKERELLSEIVRITRDAEGLGLALRQLQNLLATEYGGALLILRPASGSPATAASPHISEFLESRNFPFRGLYTAPVAGARRHAGTLVACIGAFGAPGDLLRRVTAFAAEQISDLARRLALPALEYTEAA